LEALQEVFPLAFEALFAPLEFPLELQLELLPPPPVVPFAVPLFLKSQVELEPLLVQLVHLVLSLLLPVPPLVELEVLPVF
jgi:hypothetical protein